MFKSPKIKVTHVTQVEENLYNVELEIDGQECQALSVHKLPGETFDWIDCDRLSEVKEELEEELDEVEYDAFGTDLFLSIAEAIEEPDRVS